ncbi:MAG: hypothetical protein CMM15_07475 [Rhodospirillaceae bacterium]|nr:hypothetical protein [Rhodospirillaceae bacterium]
MKILYTWISSVGYYMEAFEMFIKSLVLWKDDVTFVVLCGQLEIANKVANLSDSVGLTTEVRVVSDPVLEHLNLWSDYPVPDGAKVVYLDVKNLLCAPLSKLFDGCSKGILYCKKEGNTGYDYWAGDFFVSGNPRVDAFKPDVFLLQHSTELAGYFSTVIQDVKQNKDLRKAMIYHAISRNIVNLEYLEEKICSNPAYMMDKLIVANFPRIRGTTSLEIKRMETFLRHYILGEEGLLNYEPFKKQMTKHKINMQTFESILAKNQHHFDSIHKLCIESNEAVEGNCMYQHFVHLPVKNKWKQLNLFWMASCSERILEIGFNAGHSSLLFLLARPDSELVVFDLCEHRYTDPCFRYLDHHFPGRLTLIPGDSRTTVPLYTKEHLHETFDMVHVDGGHSMEIANRDFFNILPLASRIIIWDDTDFPHLNKLFEQYLERGFMEEVHANTTESSEHRIGQRSLCKKTFSWQNSFITFKTDGKMDAFGEGRYIILGNHIVHASFGNREHFLKFDQSYTTFTSVRKDDFFIVCGKEKSEKVPVIQADGQSTSLTKMNPINAMPLED